MSPKITKSTKPLLIILLLGLVIIGGVYYTSMPGPKRIISDIQTTHELIKRLDKSIVSIKQKSVVDAPLTEHLNEKGIGGYDFLLSGVLWDIKKPLALLNDKVVGLGEEIEGFKVVEIKEESVRLSDRHGKEQVVYIYENE